MAKWRHNNILVYVAAENSHDITVTFKQFQISW